MGLGAPPSLPVTYTASLRTVIRYFQRIVLATRTLSGSISDHNLCYVPHRKAHTPGQHVRMPIPGKGHREETRALIGMIARCVQQLPRSVSPLRHAMQLRHLSSEPPCVSGQVPCPCCCHRGLVVQYHKDCKQVALAEILSFTFDDATVCSRTFLPITSCAVLQGDECPLGRSCPHSHNAFESWLHPQKYRTLLCKDGDRCNKFVCFFAHGPDQLRLPSNPDPFLSATVSSLVSSGSFDGTLPTHGNSQQVQNLASLMDQVHIARQRAQESREAALQAEQHLLSVTTALANHAASGPQQFAQRESSSLGGVSILQAPTMQPPGLQHSSLPTATKIDAGLTSASSPLLTPVSEAMQGLLAGGLSRPVGQSLTSTPTSVLSALSASEPLAFYGSPDMSLSALPGLLGSANLQDMASAACGSLPMTTVQQQQQQAPVCIVLPQQAQQAQQPIVLYQAMGGELMPSGCNLGSSGTNSLFYYV